MGSLSCFLKENVEKRENRKVVISDRFRDKEVPVAWELRSVSAEEDEALRKACFRNVQVPGKKGQFTQNFDANAYLAKLAAAAVVFPNLDDKALQDSYGVMGAEQLVKAMLYKDEFDRLVEELTDDEDRQGINEMVEEAKN